MDFLGFPDFFCWMHDAFRQAARVQTKEWQSIDISKRPEMATHELLFVNFKVPIRNANLEYLARAIQPNMPWADDHFLERVGGEPLNPGVQWANWPHAKSADGFRDKETGQFSHTYMERFWPKYAGSHEDGLDRTKSGLPNWGYRFGYGDLNDVIDLLKRDPHTRQAYLPIFFPEDTGCHTRQRIPCTLGYHFIYRHDRLHIVYYLRSCDAANHLRDDIYLAVRLLLWMCDKLNMRPGMYVMDIVSLHLFLNDYRRIIIDGGQDEHSNIARAVVRGVDDAR